MMIDVLTLFPDMYKNVLNESIIKRAIEEKHLEVNLINFRDFAEDKHDKVDDYPYGGGAGMVLKVGPVVRALKSIENYESAKKIILTPQGSPFKQSKAYSLSQELHLIILCGHYEGYDERIRSYFDEEISIGDFVLTGGELASMVMIDAITRLLPGVIKQSSHQNDSFSNHLLEHPHYTRPREFEGQKVPDVLLNGHHAKIETWRKEHQLKKTKDKRPKLYKKYLEVKRDD
ncbi:MAG: tRNA (guanosine(37)-N1)-methyltransferase TrmD [Candidatus Izimaplasma sp.]|nr:tRNA (guanosine(37)-N1)-methyltransferase TrmD [Candidatus Izimaplasma bacterium]